jgi:hypothetical protein
MVARVMNEFRINAKLKVFFIYTMMEQPMINPGNCPVFDAFFGFLLDTYNNTHLKLTSSG